MSLKQFPELHKFLSTYFADADPDVDEDTVRAFVRNTSREPLQKVVDQTRRLLNDASLSLEELGTDANRWFGDEEEARAWLRKILAILESSSGSGSLVVKDSNGAVLAEGDSVLVIKDLKVRGGSSDLKRGTLIKKIHLIDDPEVIECRVDGSTLVLKTCFLKKA
jgi:protein PhnA